MKNLTIETHSSTVSSRLFCIIDAAELKKLLEKLEQKYVMQQLPTGNCLFFAAEHQTSLLIKAKDAGMASTAEQVMEAIRQLLSDSNLAGHVWKVSGGEINA